MEMKSFIEEKKIMATVTSIRWERIFLYLDVKVVNELAKELLENE